VVVKEAGVAEEEAAAEVVVEAVDRSKFIALSPLAESAIMATPCHGMAARYTRSEDGCYRGCHQVYLIAAENLTVTECRVEKMHPQKTVLTEKVYDGSSIRIRDEQGGERL
jgi:hypothetical protein